VAGVSCLVTSSSVYLDPFADTYRRDDDWPHPERRIPRPAAKGLEGDLVAEGLELGNGSRARSASRRMK
jgi:hypothetical protein